MVMFDSVEFIPPLLIETEACAPIFDAEILLLGALLEATEVLGDELGSTEFELEVAEASEKVKTRIDENLCTYRR